MAKEKKGLKEKISMLLTRHRYGLSIDEIARMVGISRITASKYLAVMEAEKRLSVRAIGNTKLHYLPEDFKGPKEEG
ncbi:MAG: hypothetical protein HYX24_04010 [Candidatus Aenigmarchaeota archaeon]|nr:hypothetical protein [Candidatus Aenigmarchaeota archaeon]